MPPGKRRLAVLLVILVASAAAAVVQASGGNTVLDGETGQGRDLELELDGSGKPVAFSTSVASVCRGGKRWTIDWDPRQGDAVFTQRGDRFTAREIVDRPEDDGRITSIGAVTFRAMRSAGEGIVAVLGDPARELAAYDRYVDAHEAQLVALERLGRPPDGVRLHARWIDNLRTRIRLERAQLRAGAAEEYDRARAMFARIGGLMVSGNEIGQRFGLRVCTSTGPDRTPILH